MSETILTNAELRSLGGISASIDESTVTVVNEAATAQLAEILGLGGFLKQEVTGERVRVADDFLETSRVPVDLAEEIAIQDLNGNAVEGLNFELTPGGQLRIADENRILAQEIRMDYTGGWETGGIPSELKMAVAFLAAGMIAARSAAGSGEVQSYKIGTQQVVFKSESGSQAAAVLQGLIRKWRRLSFSV